MFKFRNLHIALITFVLGACFFQKEENALNDLPNSNWSLSSAVYDTIHNLRLDLYLPKKMNLKNVSVVLYHGGGWKTGNKGAMRKPCEYLASRSIPCITPSYRINSQHSTGITEAMMDAEKAFQWVENNLSQYGIDSSKIWVGGASAGGLNALWQNSPHGLLLWNPVIKTVGDSAFENELTSDEVNPKIDGLLNLGQGIQATPTYIHHGDSDEIVDILGSQEFCQALDELGESCELKVWEGYNHGVIFQDSIDLVESLDDFVKFISDHS